MATGSGHRPTGPLPAWAPGAGITVLSLACLLLLACPALAGTLDVASGTLEEGSLTDETIEETTSQVEATTDATDADDGKSLETEVSADLGAGLSATTASGEIETSLADASLEVSSSESREDPPAPDEGPSIELGLGVGTDGSTGDQADGDEAALHPHAWEDTPQALANPVPDGQTLDPRTAAPVAAVLAAALASALKYASGGGLATLYSRIGREELLENENRQRLVALVEDEPGVSLSELADELGLGWGATVYHLERLEDAGHLASRRAGKRRCFYRPGTRDAEQVDALGLLRDERARTVAEHILENPGTSQSDVADGIEASSATVHRRVEKLREADLVEAKRRGRCVAYAPTERLRSLVDEASPVPA